MALLVLFAFVAGAGTALTPCVLPVLPAVLASAGSGGRRRPLGVILGLVSTFTLAIVALASVIDGVGLPNGTVRTLAVVVLLVFGVSLLVPALAARIEAPLTRLARFGPRERGEGFWSGLLVGAGLGFVYAPCAGPILAAVVSVSATRGASGEVVAVALGYAAGSALVLLLLAYGGRRVLDRLRAAGRGPAVQRALGVVLVATAVAVATDLDVRFQTALANDFPAFLTNPTKSLERSGAVEDRLARLRGPARFAETKTTTASTGPACRAPGARRAPGLHRQPALVQHAGRGAARHQAAARAGRARRLLDLHLHQLHPHAALRARLGRPLPQGRASRSSAYTRPSSPFERDAGNVERAIAQNQLRYPVARTTTTPPGTPGATSTGPPSTWSTRAGACATRTSARATTTRPSRRSVRCWRRPAPLTSGRRRTRTR